VNWPTVILALFKLSTCETKFLCAPIEQLLVHILLSRTDNMKHPKFLDEYVLLVFPSTFSMISVFF
jgi:hypothetical protein